MQTYLACFDITDDKIRYRVGKLLGSFGNRVQNSVFEVRFKRPSQMLQVRDEISDLLEDTDDCRFYSLCLSCRRKSQDCAGQQIAVFPAAIVI